MIQGFAGLHALQGAGHAQGGLPLSAWPAVSIEGRARRRGYHCTQQVQGPCSAAASSTQSAGSQVQQHRHARRKWHQPSLQVELLDNHTSNPQLPPAHHQLEHLLGVAGPVEHLHLPEPVHDELELHYSLAQDEGDELDGQVHAVLQPSLPTADRHSVQSVSDQQLLQEASNSGDRIMHQRHGRTGSRHRSQQDRYRGQQNNSTGGDRSEQQPAILWESPGLHPAALTSKLTKCRSFAALHQTYTEHKDAFNHLHVACTLNRLAKCPASDSQVEEAQHMLRTLEQMFAYHLPLYSAREVANAAWVWAKLAHQPSSNTRAMVIATLTAKRAALLRDKQVAPQALCNLAYALAVLGWHEPQLWSALTDVVLYCLKRHQRLHASSALNSQRTQQHSSHKQQHSSHKQGSRRSWQQVRPVDRAATAAASESYKHDEGQGSRYMAPGNTTQWAAMDCASIAWSFATAKQYHEELFDVLVACIKDQIKDVYPIDLSQALWACAIVRHNSPQLFAAAKPIVLECMQGFTDQGLANVAWAYAMSGAPEAASIVVGVCRQAVGRLHKFKPMHLVQLTWAMVKTQQVHPPIVSAALAHAQSYSQQWSSRNLSLLVYSTAQCGLLDSTQLALLQPQLLQRLQADIRLLDDLSASSSHAADSKPNITQQGPAPAQTGHQSDPKWSQEHKRAPAIVFHNASQIVWAYAHTAAYNAEVYNAATHLCLNHVGGWLGSPASFQTLLWSLGYGRHYHPTLFNIAAQHLAFGQPWQDGMTSSQVAGALVALAGMQHYDQGACSAVAAYITTLCRQDPNAANSETLVNVPWALAMLDHLEPGLLQVLLPTLVARWRTQVSHEQGAGNYTDSAVNDPLGDEDGSMLERSKHAGSNGHPASQPPRKDHMLSTKNMAQMFQIYMWLQDRGSQAGTSQQATSTTLCSLLPDDFVAAARQVWVQQVHHKSSVSLLQEEVYKALLSLGLSVKLETVSDDKLFSIDCLVCIGSHKVALEVNGPMHYAASHHDRMLGSKALRDRLLSRRGYAMLNLPYWEWEALKKDMVDGQQYLLQKLEQVVGQDAMQQHRQQHMRLHQ